MARRSMEVAEPVRTCIGCGAKRPKRELTRLVVRDGRVEVAGAGAVGRGAYVCAGACAAKALAKKAYGRALKGRAAADEALVAQVEVVRRGRCDGTG